MNAAKNAKEKATSAAQQGQYQTQQPTYQPEKDGEKTSTLSVRAASILCYLFSFVGWLVAYFLGDNQDGYLKFHLNQSLVLWVLGLVAGLISRIRYIGFIGSLAGLAVFVLWIIAFIGTIKGEAKSAPFLDQIQILK